MKPLAASCVALTVAVSACGPSQTHNRKSETEVSALAVTHQGQAAIAHKNYKAAFQFFGSAARTGFAEAEYQFGMMYMQGLGVTKNYESASVWVGKAAQQGHARAQLMLSAAYGAGGGMPQNYVEAYKWADLAAAHNGAGDDTHDKAVVMMRALEGLMTPEQIAEGQKAATQWAAKKSTRL